MTKKTGMKQIKRLIQSLSIILVIMLFSGCSVIEQIAEYNLERLEEEKEVNIDNTLKLPESTYVKQNIELTMSNPKSLNPLDKTEYTISQALNLIYQPVLNLDSDYKLNNGITQSFEKVGEKVYRFTINDKAIFHNEIPVLAKDVIYSFDYLSKNIESPYYFATKYIEGITEVSDKVFDVKFIDLDYYNLYALVFPIISKDYLESDEYDALKPIGSGPYKYKEFQTMIRLELEQNTAYMEGTPKARYVFANIVREPIDDYNMFLAKRTDVHSPLFTNWMSYSDDRLIEEYLYDSPFYYFIGINHNRSFVKSLNGRQLVASFVPYESIKKDAFLNHLNFVTLPIVSSHYLIKGMDPYYGVLDESSYYMRKYSKENQSKYLKAIDLETNNLIEYSPVILDLLYNLDDPYQIAIIDCFKNTKQLYQLKFNYVGLSKEAYLLAIDAGSFDLFVGSIKTGVIPNFEDVFKAEGILNKGKYVNMNINGLLSSYRKTDNSDLFIKQLENLSKVISDDLPIIPLGFLENGVFVHNQLGKGASPTHVNQYNQFDKIDILKLDSVEGLLD